jgi:hypothetical protein
MFLLTSRTDHIWIRRFFPKQQGKISASICATDYMRKGNPLGTSAKASALTLSTGAVQDLMHKSTLIVPVVVVVAAAGTVAVVAPDLVPSSLRYHAREVGSRYRYLSGKRTAPPSTLDRVYDAVKAVTTTSEDVTTGDDREVRNSVRRRDVPTPATASSGTGS